MTLAGFVVAGGQSSRMGRDKALMPYRGMTLLDHAIARLREASDETFVLCGPTRRYEDCGVSVVEDAICGAGPLGGLYTALTRARSSGHEYTLWLAVDLPLVPESFLKTLIGHLGDAQVAMARSERGIEPLCAAFATEPCVDAVRRSILANRLKLTDAVAGLKVLEVPGETAFFANVNSPADYEGLKDPAV